MVSTCLLISKSSKAFINSLGIVPSTQTTTGITVTFIFHIFLVLRQGLGSYLSFRFLLFLLCSLSERQNPLFGRFSFFSWLALGLFVWPRLGDPFASQNTREYCTCSYGQMSVVSSLFALIYCICILYDCSIRLYHHIININYFVALYIFLL